jgi:hypothetical protein
MKIYTGILYIVARLEVLYSQMTRRIASSSDHDDMLPLSLVPSFALGDCNDRILAEVDQDGFVFATDQRDAILFNTKGAMSWRKHHRIQIVLRGSMVFLRKAMVRKQHVEIPDRIREFLQWEFYIETAALLRLRGLACVPTIRRIDCRDGTIEMDYIWGRDLRQILASGTHEISYEEISRSFAALVAAGNTDDMSRQLAETVINVIRRGVIPRDVHAANFVWGQRSNRLYMVDFNLVYLYPVPGWRSHVRALTWLLRDRVEDIFGMGI